MIDYEILGDVLIPLENSNFFENKSTITLEDLNKCDYKSFRKILFQGESIKFYIVIQANKKNIPNISSVYDKLYFNIEFESTEVVKNININKEENSISNEEDEDSEKPYFKFYTSNKNVEDNEIISKKIRFNNRELETVNIKYFDKESSCEIYEIIKEILVPENYINLNLLMKVNIYFENDSVFSENNKEEDILNLYQMGIFNYIEKYKLLKTIFKEVKVINALDILNLKQIEPKIDTTLLQTKINNYNNYELIDKSLKFSKIFKNFGTQNEDSKEYENDKIIEIKGIRILKDETSFDEKATENIEFIKEKLIKEKKLLNKNDFNITIFNKNKFPYSIGPGEEFNLILKIIKNSYINESIGSYNKLYNANNNKNKNKQLVLLTQNDTQNEVSKIIINTLNDASTHSSLLSNKLSEENEVKFLKRNSVLPSAFNKNILSQKIQEPLLSLGNLFKKKTTIITNDKISNEKISINNSDSPNKKENNKTQKNDTTIENKENSNNQNNKLDLDNYFDEKFKIYYITSIILELSSKLFYENVNMCIQMKWFNEINRYLIISIIIPECIKTNQYFEVFIKIKNISFNPMNLIIQIKDNENQDSPVVNKNKNIENVPCILSQTKIEHLGLLDCDDEKIYNLKFLPLIQGYCYLPNLTLIDIYSERKFYIVQTNKIFVEDENKTT